MDSKAKIPAGTPEGDYNDRRLRFTWNDDVLMEILLWLPAKSIIRFKSVCKHWLSLFSSDKFCHLHTLRCSKLQPSLILETPDSQFFYFDPIMNSKKPMIPYSLSFSYPDPLIISSCNGLMLLISPLIEQSFHVYNPTTKRSRKIDLPDGDNILDTEALSLAFDPSKSPHYKVVCIRSVTEDLPGMPTYQIEVYDSENCTWNLSLGPFTSPETLWIVQGAYMNGSIYWQMLCVDGCYDIAKNEFKTFSRPNYPLSEDGYSFHHLQELNSHLYQSRFVTEGECQSFTLFELQTDDRSSWLLKYHEIITRNPPALAQPLRFINGSYGTETFSLVYHMSGKKRLQFS